MISEIEKNDNLYSDMIFWQFLESKKPFSVHVLCHLRMVQSGTDSFLALKDQL